MSNLSIVEEQLKRQKSHNLGEATEEDWSSLIPDGTGLLPTYEEITIPLFPDQNVSLNLKCLTRRQLSPLDITNSLSTGDHDATGHHVWLASYFFLDVIVRPLETKTLSIEQIREKIFFGKRILELGCGTGIAGIALMMAITEQASGKIHQCYPALFMTDADPDALQLCKINCKINDLKCPVFVTTLQWGTDCWIEEDRQLNTVLNRESFDTVFAADAVYDLEVLPLLMKSAFEALLPKGNFALSHVPRFASSSVESLIIDEANKVGFILVYRLYPRDVYTKIEKLNEFEEKNAVLFFFEKQI